MFYFSKICGFAPYGLTKTGTSNTSYFDYFLSTVVLCVYLYIFEAKLDFLSRKFLTDSMILNIGIHIMQSTMLLVASASLLFSFITKMESRNIFDILDTCDKEVCAFVLKIIKFKKNI